MLNDWMEKDEEIIQKEEIKIEQKEKDNEVKQKEPIQNKFIASVESIDLTNVDFNNPKEIGNIL